MKSRDLRLVEVAFGEFRLHVDRLAPVGFCLFVAALGFESMAEVEKGFRKLGPLIQRLLIEANGVIQLTGFLQQQARVVKDFGRAFADVD